MASLTFQQKLFTAVYSVGGTKLFLRQNVSFFSKTPGFDSDSEKNTLAFIWFLNSLNLLQVLPVLVMPRLGMNFVPSDKTLIVAKFGRKLFDKL